MNLIGWATKLNGREYRKEILQGEGKQMVEDGIIAAFGASDDLLEFEGTLNDEYSAWEGAEAKVFKRADGKVELLNDDRVEEVRGDQLSFTTAQIVNMLIIKAIWAPIELETSWLIETAIPHEHFDIMEDGELYCRGIVFHVDDIPMLEQRGEAETK